MPPTLDFKAIPTQIIMQVYVLTHLPPSLYALAYPKRHTPLVDGSIPGLIASGSASGFSSGSDPANSHGTASTVSVLTTPPPTKPPPSGRGAYMANLTPVTSLQLWIALTSKLKTKLAPDPHRKQLTEPKCACPFTFVVAAGLIVAALRTMHVPLLHLTFKNYNNM
jgi:hypothetical protein